MKYKKIKSKIAYTNKWFKIEKHSVMQPDGKKGTYCFLSKTPGVVIIALDKNNSIFFTKEYRYPVNRTMLQLPAGSRAEKGFIKEGTKELFEETGIKAKNIKKIGSFFIAPGHENTFVYVLLATNLDISELDELSNRPKNHVDGIFAERMIINFLIRAQYNNPELKMRVEKSNALEDTILKYDFKIEIKKLLGVALESKDFPREKFIKQKRLGVQFTVGKSGKLKNIELGKKRLPEFANMLHRNVDDVVLVRIKELSNFVELYRRWRFDGKPSGGPEQYLSEEEKISIFKQAMKPLRDLSDGELKGLNL